LSCDTMAIYLYLSIYACRYMLRRVCSCIWSYIYLMQSSVTTHLCLLLPLDRCWQSTWTPLRVDRTRSASGKTLTWPSASRRWVRDTACHQPLAIWLISWLILCVNRSAGWEYTALWHSRWVRPRAVSPLHAGAASGVPRPS
jgi:hypothetical protein